MSTTRQLTGGTGDVNPQCMVIVLQQGTANATVTSSVQLPINRLVGNRRGRSTVMEVLKVSYFADAIPALNTAGNQTVAWDVQISTKALGGLNIGDPTVVDIVQEKGSYFFTAGGSLSLKFESLPIIHDLTDGAGHGILVASDSLYFVFGSQGLTTATVADVRIYYRFKEVTLEEYIGLVQSQQT